MQCFTVALFIQNKTNSMRTMASRHEPSGNRAAVSDCAGPISQKRLGLICRVGRSFQVKIPMAVFMATEILMWKSVLMMIRVLFWPIL